MYYKYLACELTSILPTIYLAARRSIRSIFYRLFTDTFGGRLVSAEVRPLPVPPLSYYIDMVHQDSGSKSLLLQPISIGKDCSIDEVEMTKSTMPYSPTKSWSKHTQGISNYLELSAEIRCLQ